MSSSEQPETPSNPATSVNRTLTAVFPFILGFTSTTHQPSDNRQNNRPLPDLPEGFVILNPLVTIPYLNLETLFSQMMLPKSGPLPASKASIDAMPVVEVTEESLEECPICLSEYEIGGELKEMPCKHRFHMGCIEKWLGMNGSCPVCRYSMPVETKEEEERGRTVGELSVTFQFEFAGGRTRNNNNNNQDSDLRGSGENPTPPSTEEADCNS
ncbi:E3 ubiquitin-protein ligase MPSR1-like [Impatiens glandulifera]|uniref:E3 ubiquitin-protein ligase MPSR1-like n=1 Tax=Impatiens glandulifera TaxID=253017 RepID=UPI001FB0F30C|nr:E3 ubiquitin-protein ligase MPSR1-like [Impatiens glandulifera]